ncbi:uncharacterized protein LOC134647504 [Cydia amplana]|uniref:uncharacterized protein LOC134647504 n=1 Tax=Cydia amplana TaxID=1869771 RepID=UPI002FE51734
MVNGHYIMYGDRPSSESEIVEDHVQTRTAERKTRRKAHRTANELQPSLAQLDNETDSVKYEKKEKKSKEPKILRYVPNTEVEEHQVSDNYETYDLKTTDAKPRRYTFKKKPKNPADGSVNYAYSRSNSSSSSPNGNLPTIAEHGEALSTRHTAPPSPTVSEIITGYENKLDKYFNKPREVKKYRSKGSHPDSLYRVPLGTGAGGGKMARLLRVMRWPVALIVVCVALAIFVYFLMPDNFQAGPEMINATYWESNVAVADTHRAHDHTYKPPAEPKKINNKVTADTRTPEIDFYDADHNKNEELQAVISTITDKQTKLPIPPVFPTHLTPEVQYGNENADTENLRSPKVLHEINQLPADSTLKPHITQKPEKPLAIYFKDGEGVTTTTTTTTTSTKDAISEAMVNNLYTIHSDKITPQKVDDLAYKPLLGLLPWPIKTANLRPVLPPEMQEFYIQGPAKTNFTSGHSKLFGIGIEDAEKMQSTTQSSVYNTRVSPTLPTWRDRDDTTTKNYPVNVNPDVSQCRSTSQPLCRGVLPYDLAGKPASFGGVSVATLLPQILFVAATNCSVRFKTFACALLEPECSPAPYAPKMPCYNLCKAVLDGCESDIPHELRTILNCKQYSSANCVAARTPCERQEMPCSDGTCIPRDWICDGAHDCPAGEDENICGTCQPHEFRCESGTCIHSRWKCDGYADCPDGDDESEARCGGVEELGEEPAGSAPQPAVHRANRVPAPKKVHRSGEVRRGAARRAPRQQGAGAEEDPPVRCVDSVNCNDKREARCGGVPEELGEEPAGSAPQPAVHRANRVPAPKKTHRREARCGGVPEELGEEPAGSAPQPAVHRANRVPAPKKVHRSGDDSSKELLMTSDSTNALKRNFTRRPSLSRLTPYTPAMLQATKSKKTESDDDANKHKHDTEEEIEDAQADDLTVLEDTKVITELPEKHKRAEDRPKNQTNLNIKPKIAYKNLTKVNPLQGRAPMPRPKPAKVENPALLAYPAEPTKLDQSINKLERVINGADLMKMLSQKAQRPSPATESGESQENTTADRPEKADNIGGKSSAHASPCPESELRCVDGRCITLAQLCDGTIDCSDHADEDNCYT